MAATIDLNGILPFGGRHRRLNWAARRAAATAGSATAPARRREGGGG